LIGEFNISNLNGNYTLIYDLQCKIYLTIINEKPLYIVVVKQGNIRRSNFVEKSGVLIKNGQ